MQQQVRDSFEALAANALTSSSRQFLELADQKIGNVHRDRGRDLGRTPAGAGHAGQPHPRTPRPGGREAGEADKPASTMAQHGIAAERRRPGAAAAAAGNPEPGPRAALPRRARAVGRSAAAQGRGARGHAGALRLRPAADHLLRRRPAPPRYAVNLPGGRTIVVDARRRSRRSSTRRGAADEGVRSGKLADHVRQVKDHVTKLGAKGYWDPLPSSPELVVLFLPAEAIYMAALEQDAPLIDYGVKQRVLIASPLTLIALLRTAAFGWRQERLTINAEEISQLGRELHESARTFAEQFEALGHRLGRAVRAYNEAVGAYDTRVMVSMRKFRELGPPAATRSSRSSRWTPRRASSKSAMQRDLLEEQRGGGGMRGQGCSNVQSARVQRCTGAEVHGCRGARVQAGCRVHGCGVHGCGGGGRGGSMSEMVRVVAVSLPLMSAASAAGAAGSPRRRRSAGKPLVSAHRRFRTRPEAGEGPPGGAVGGRPRHRRGDDLGRPPLGLSVAIPGRDRDVHQGHRALPGQSALLPPPRPSLHHASGSSTRRRPISKRPHR